MIPIQQQIECVEREIVLRRRVYADRVKKGRMSKAAARREYDTMRAVLATLKEYAKGTIPIQFNGEYGND